MEELTLEARNGNIDRVVDFVNEQLTFYNCSTTILKQLEMAIEEIFVNIAVYAYSPNAGNVTISCEMQE